MLMSYKKNILFYAGWVIIFTLIALSSDIRSGELTIYRVLTAFVLSCVISYFAVRSLFKMINKQVNENDKANIELLPNEELIVKSNANLKAKVILYDGILFFTNKRIQYIQNEVFFRNKKRFELQTDEITKIECVDNTKLIIEEKTGKKYVFYVDEAQLVLIVSAAARTMSLS